MQRPVILVVDDTPQNLRLLGEMLDAEGYEVRVATDGEQALNSIRLSPPNLILLDILMPGLSGYDVCRQLKADPTTSAIPVIFLSASSLAEQKVQAFREGAVDYITKPFRPEEVVVRVRTHLRLLHGLHDAIKRIAELIERMVDAPNLTAEQKEWLTAIDQQCHQHLALRDVSPVAVSSAFISPA